MRRGDAAIQEDRSRRCPANVQGPVPVVKMAAALDESPVPFLST